jgi:UPF0755 protein
MGAVSYGFIFRAGAAYQNRTGLLKAGSFLIEPGTSMEDIVKEITTSGRSTCGSEINFKIGISTAEAELRSFDPATGKLAVAASFVPGTDPVPADYTKALGEADMRFRVTLAEGVTSWQVVNALKSAEFLSSDVNDIPAEGTLAPGSYEVTSGESRGQLLSDMAARQSDIIATAWEGRDKGLPLHSPDDMLILASIIEKETGVPDERRTIAQVFINRLEQGIRLQTDPTVIYGITKGEGVLGRGLKRSELDRKTPWNTYQVDGLPPTPICNPGKASIEAAVHPDGSKYLYFVADGSGGHAFSTTLAEHQKNVAKWRAIQDKQSGN